MIGETEPAGQLRQYVGGLLCRRVIRIKSRQVLKYRGQVAGTYQVLCLRAGHQNVAYRGEKLAVHAVSRFQSLGITDIQPSVTAPVNISHLPSPGVLATDVGRGAAIAVTVIGQRLNTGRHL